MAISTSDMRTLVCAAAAGTALAATAEANAANTPAGEALDTVTCVSMDGERQHCAGYTMGGVALQQSVGSAACLLGRNWGYDAQGVWVTEGCGGRFVLGNEAAEQQRVVPQPGGGSGSVVVAASPGDEVQPGDDLGRFEAYARFGARAAVRDEEAEVQDASSRIRFGYEYGGQVRLFAAAEWAVNFAGSRTELNPGESTGSGFVLLDTVSTELLSNRLGFVGLDFGDAGRLTLGKQWGVHYDITSFTDAFNVFGANASATFNAGTDGGFTGTGRADSALSYRNRFFGKLDLGAQIQMRDLSNQEFVDGLGISARLEVLPGLTAGAAYTRAMIDDSLKGQLLGLKGDSEYAAFGIRYVSDAFKLAGVYVRQTNGDLARIPGFDGELPITIPVVFDATGLELFGRYQMGRLGLLAGYLDYRPDIEEGSLIDPDAQLQYVVLGLDYQLNPRALFFAEYRLSDGVSYEGIPGDDIFALGFQYGFKRGGEFDLD